MARAKKPNGEGTEIVATTLLMPPTKTVQDLAKAKRNAKKNNSEINGAVGQKIAKAAEEKHLDRTAFSIACRINDLSDERIGATYYHLLRYIEDLGIDKRASAQNEMFEEKEIEADDKVTPIGRAARRVAEQAGEASSA